MPTIFNSKDSVFFVGGRGTKAGTANAGGCTLEAWLDPAKLNQLLANVMNANGDILDVAITAAISDNGSGKVRITSAGDFNDSKVGLVANIVFSATYTSGRYEVLAIDAGNNYIDIDLAWSTSVPTCNVWVGGAFNTGQNAWDNTDAMNGYSVIIHSNKNQSKTNGDFTTTWNLGTAGGSQVNKSFKRFAGFTTQPEDGGQVTFDGEDDAAFNAAGGINYNGTLYNTIFENVIVEDACNCWRAVTTANLYSNKMINCEGNGGTNAGWILTWGRSWALIGCKAQNNGGVGFDLHQGSTVVNHFLLKCIAYNNTLQGFNLGGHPGGVAIGCLAYGNGAEGFMTTAGFGVGALISCVAYDNSLEGFEFTKSNPIAINCIAKDNGSWGFYANTGGGLMAPHVTHCCAHGNTTGQFSLPDALPEQNSIETDPQFVDAENGDFRLKLSSPAFRTGKPTLGKL